MTIRIGDARPAPSDLAGLLLDCHERIRRFAALARTVAEADATTPPEQVASAAGQVRRYFAEALPRHVADEDLSIAPRLAGRDPSVDAALTTMTAQHRDHQTQIDRLVALCGRLERAPGDLGAVADELAPLADQLDAELAAHLQLEESVIVPALEDLLSADERDAIVGELRARRQPPA